MTAYNAAAVVHINENLSDQQIHELEYHLAQERGITAACVNDRARHLMVVDYDAESIAAKNVLNDVQASGYHAELIGGI
ncbi:MAG: heavy-metal-associated domain-containing protein [bacterium]